MNESLADMIKINHLITQMTDESAGASIKTMLGLYKTIDSLEDLKRLELSDVELQVVRVLYDQIRSQETGPRAPERLTYQASFLWSLRHSPCGESRCQTI